MIRILMFLSLAPFFAACATTVGAEARRDPVGPSYGGHSRMGPVHFGGDVSGAMRRRGLSQRVTRAHRPMTGCESGPFALEIRNKTEYFLRLQIDGEDIAIAGAHGILPLLPPGERTHVCLDSEGSHHITGVVYARRYNELLELDRFSVHPRFRGDRRGAYPRQIYSVTEYVIRHN